MIPSTACQGTWARLPPLRGAGALPALAKVCGMAPAPCARQCPDGDGNFMVFQCPCPKCHDVLSRESNGTNSSRQSSVSEAAAPMMCQALCMQIARLGGCPSGNDRQHFSQLRNPRPEFANSPDDVGHCSWDRGLSLHGSGAQRRQQGLQLIFGQRSAAPLAAAQSAARIWQQPRRCWPLLVGPARLPLHESGARAAAARTATAPGQPQCRAAHSE